MKILVPLDFSPNSIHAFEFALALAQREKSEIQLIYVVEHIYDFAAQSALALESHWAEAEQKFKDLKEKYASSEVLISYQIEEGTPSISISKFAHESDVNLIVMGTKGAHGMKKWLIGSTAANTIKESTKPVLVIPENSNLTHIQKITLALEFEDHEPKYIDWIVGKCDQWHLGLDFLHIQIANDFKEELSVMGLEKYISKKFPTMPVKIHTFFAETPNDGLELYMEEHEESILMVCHKQRSLWSDLLENSESLHLAYSAPIPILVMV